jgi:DNA-binding transcriptional MerR regulator
MFTQLDLFGDLPAPEKPSNQSQRTEKKSTARSGSAGSHTHAVQTQLSMGLTEPTFPEPSRAWTGQGDAQQPETPEDHPTAISEQPGKDLGDHADLPLSEPMTTLPVGDSISGSAHSQDQGADQQAGLVMPTSNQENSKETRAEKGRRYYIQTEIPADPPLAEKPPGPEMMLAYLVTNRPSAQEPKPRYIQTEIPSDPMNPVDISGKPEEAKDLIGAEFAGSEPLVSSSQASTSDTTDNHVRDREKQEKALADMRAESLRRTRPLMPPKVIMAEPERSSVNMPSKSPEPEEVPQIKQQVTKEDTIRIRETGASNNQTKEDRFSKTTAPIVQEPQHSPATPLESTPESGVQTIQKTPIRRKKGVKEPVIESSVTGVPPDEQLNARQYYSIGEVATMFSVKSSLLRYWESEFDVLKLRKNRKGDRFFRPDDIRSLQLIHHLLRDKKYTIEGAREYMRNAGKMKEKFETIETLRRIRQFLVEMRNGLQIERLQDAQ